MQSSAYTLRLDAALFFFFFSSRRRHTRFKCDWSSDVCSSDLLYLGAYMRLPLVPLFASDLGATTVQVGMINTGFMVAAALLSLPLGLVSDRLGRNRLILSGMAISGLTSLFLLLVRTPLQVD